MFILIEKDMINMEDIMMTLVNMFLEKVGIMIIYVMKVKKMIMIYSMMKKRKLK